MRGRALRATLGQVFTPPALADALASVLPLGESGTVLDPACGAGSLLVAVLERRRAAGWSVAEALGSLEGWDRDPVAAWLCRARLVEWALERPDGAVPGALRVHAVDALARSGRPAEIGEVRAVIGNPPYLEAKRMRSAEPGLKERLLERFPQLSGAFDLYLGFTWLSLELVQPGGDVALLVPNKVCQGRYAAGFRKALLEPGAPTLCGLVDLSRMKPRPFPGTGVYPVILHLRRRVPSGPVRMRRVLAPEDLDREDWQSVGRESLRLVGGEHPIFTPFRTWPTLERLFALERLGAVASLASTCSFHKKGLRERFVHASRPSTERARPYLGLRSRARRTEVAPFRVRWEGGWIDYDNGRLKAEFRNPLPPLATFERPKILWCQHALRMRAVADPEGRWVSKDTYPVCWPTGPHWTLGRLLAVLNSTVFTALYNTVYQGIVVGGETYHYLPAFLRHVPVPAGDHPDLRRADDLVAALSGEGPVDGGLWEELDRHVSAAYGISESERRELVEVHLARVGAEVPG